MWAGIADRTSQVLTALAHNQAYIDAAKKTFGSWTNRELPPCRQRVSISTRARSFSCF